MEIRELKESDLNEVVYAILDQPVYSSMILLKGDLGSGKTTLAKALLKELGVNDVVTSPTFNIVSEYQTIKGETIYHFDLYRIESIEELYDIGFEEYLASGNRCIIEWPEIAGVLLNTDRTQVDITIRDHSRKYDISRLNAVDA